MTRCDLTIFIFKFLKVGEETDDDEDEASRKISSSSGEDSAIGSDLKPWNNPFSSPGGSFGLFPGLRSKLMAESSPLELEIFLKTSSSSSPVSSPT